MAGQLLLRCRSSPLSSPGFRLGFIVPNLPTFDRPFSTRRINLKTDYSSKLAEAECSDHWKVFKSWMSKHKKRYRSDKEMLYRFNIFTDRLKSVEERNKENSGCTFGLNHFSDRTREECLRTAGALSRSRFAELMDVICTEEWKEFDSWMAKHKKKYPSHEEKFRRFKIFKECLKNIEKANKENPECTFGLNRFSDLTSEELPRGKSAFSKLPSGWVCLSKLLPTVPFSMRKGSG